LWIIRCRRLRSERSFVKESVPPYMVVSGESGRRSVWEDRGRSRGGDEVCGGERVVPVAVSLEPFQVRMVPFAEMPERSRPIFPRK